MAKPRPLLVQTRLHEPERTAFQNLVKATGESSAVVVREAIRLLLRQICENVESTRGAAAQQREGSR